MVCFHANADVHFDYIVSTGTVGSNVAHQIDSFFTEFDGTHFFMMLSAFLLYRDLSGDNIKGKMHRRIKSLLIPWIVWNIIGMISYHDFDKGIGYLIRYFLTSRFCGQLWFVEALLIFLLFIPVFIRVFKIKFIREAILLAVFIIVYYLMPVLREAAFFPSELSRWEVIRVLEHVPTYCLGVYLGLNYAEFVMSEEYNNKHRLLSLAAAAVILLLSYLIPNCIVGYFLGRMKFIALWIILRKQYFSFEPKWWMQIPFYTYAVHNFILYWEGKIIKLSGLFSEEFATSTVTEGFALAWRIGLSAIAIPIIMLSAKILIKYTPGFYKLLSGGRLPDRI